jgi:hypothetical protein
MQIMIAPETNVSALFRGHAGERCRTLSHPQRNNRIGIRRALRRQQARHQRGHHHDCHHRRKRQRIRRLNSEE